jgi:hypothetical protein
MEKPCIRLQFHFTSERPVRCVAMLPIISSPFRASRTSRSWKARRLSATSSLDACRVARLFLIGSSETRRRPVSHQIYIPNNRHQARRPAEGFRVVKAGRAKWNERQRTGGRDRIIAGLMAFSILLPIIVGWPRRYDQCECQSMLFLLASPAAW